jgi:hypothetical protein
MPEQQTMRSGRFADPQRGSGVLGGLQGSTALPDTFTQKDIKRNLKPFKRFGMPQNIRAFAKKSDTQIENLAATAVVKRGIKQGSIDRKRLRTKPNRKLFNKKQLRFARRVMAKDSPRQQALNKTRAARRHIRMLRRNRAIAKTRLFPKNV